MADIRGIPGSEYKDTLLGSFLEDDCLDELRQIAADMGARPYRVFLVKTRWSGKRRGEGVETVTSEVEILPTPKVDSIDNLNLQLLDIGTDDAGMLKVREISPRYQENQLRGLNPDGSEIAQNETFSWEISLSRGDAEEKKRRRFVIRGVPIYHSSSGGALQWHVSLTRAGSDRNASGAPG